MNKKQIKAIFSSVLASAIIFGLLFSPLSVSATSAAQASPSYETQSLEAPSDRAGLLSVLYSFFNQKEIKIQIKYNKIGTQSLQVSFKPTGNATAYLDGKVALWKYNAFEGRNVKVGFRDISTWISKKEISEIIHINRKDGDFDFLEYKYTLSIPEFPSSLKNYEGKIDKKYLSLFSNYT